MPAVLIPAAEGIKERHLRLCHICERTPLAGVDFHRIRLTRFVVRRPAVVRRSGLEMQIGALASALSPDEDLATALEPERTLIVCGRCALDPRLLLVSILYSEKD